MTSSIQTKSYSDVEKELTADPIIQQMARTLPREALANLTYADGAPRWDFIQRALDIYHDKGGKISTHIGGPARALLWLKNAEN